MLDLRNLLLDIIRKIPLCNAAWEVAILLQPQHWPQAGYAYDAEDGCNQMPDEHEPVAHVGQEEFDKLGGLIKIFLLGDIVECLLPMGRYVVPRAVGREIQNGRQRCWRNVERYKPN